MLAVGASSRLAVCALDSVSAAAMALRNAPVYWTLRWTTSFKRCSGSTPVTLGIANPDSSPLKARMTWFRNSRLSAKRCAAGAASLNPELKPFKSCWMR